MAEEPKQKRGRDRAAGHRAKDEAKAMTRAGADLLVCHVGLTTAGSIGAAVAFTLDEALRPLPEEAETFEEVEIQIPETTSEADFFPDPEEEIEQFEEVPQSEETEE